MVQSGDFKKIKLWVDDRLGGVPRYVLSFDDRETMLIHEEIRKCVGFLLCKRAMADPPKVGGTAFLAGIEDENAGVGFAYAVTARHVIEHVQAESPDDKVLLRLNLVAGGFGFIESKVQDWLFHPNEETVDVAVLPLRTPPEFDAQVYRLNPERIAGPEIIVREGIGPGDEVFIAGLFRNHYGTDRNIPVVRIGSIAAMPEEKVKVKWKDASMDAYLIEARSIGGLSGSPVFVHTGPVRLRDGKVMIAEHRGGIWWLLGLMHGHFNVRVPDIDVAEDGLSSFEVNAGLAIVTPATKIMEVINQKKLLDMRQDIVAKFIRAKAAEPDSR